MISKRNLTNSFEIYLKRSKVKQIFEIKEI